MRGSVQAGYERAVSRESSVAPLPVFAWRGCEVEVIWVGGGCVETNGRLSGAPRLARCQAAPCMYPLTRRRRFNLLR